jgi:hypothetical protein
MLFLTPGIGRTSLPIEDFRPPDVQETVPRSVPGRSWGHAQIARLEGELAGTREALVEARARLAA